MRLALPLRELEQVERALDVDVMRGHRRELGPRRQQRREMEHAIDLELGEHAIEQVGVGDRAGELARARAAPAPASSGLTSSVMIGDPDDRDA